MVQACVQIEHIATPSSCPYAGWSRYKARAASHHYRMHPAALDQAGAWVARAHLHSFRKFLLASGHSSVYKSTTRSPMLVSMYTDMLPKGEQLAPGTAHVADMEVARRRRDAALGHVSATENTTVCVCISTPVRVDVQAVSRRAQRAALT